MRMSVVMGIVLTQCVVWGTTCVSNVQPCERVRPDSVFFIGEVVQAIREVPPPEPGVRASEFRVRVKEPLLGLSEDVSEMQIVMFDSVPLGTDRLFDMGRKPDESLEFTLCGVSGSISGDRSYPDSVKMVEYLRAAKRRGVEEGSARIRTRQAGVWGREGMIRGARAVLERSLFRRESTAVADTVWFHNVPPGTYRVYALKEGYSPIESSVTVLAHGCPTRWVDLRPIQEVSGVMRGADGRPAAGVDLYLWEQEHYLKVQVLRARSDENGAFAFRAVRAGRYYLMTADPRRRTYYPGKKAKNESIELKVDTNNSITGLEFKLVDDWRERNIRVRVLDPSGNPARWVSVTDYPFDDAMHQDRYGSLARLQRTRADGTVLLQGWAGVHYRVDAATQWERSKPTDILPGEGDVEVVVKLIQR